MQTHTLIASFDSDLLELSYKQDLSIPLALNMDFKAGKCAKLTQKALKKRDLKEALCFYCPNIKHLPLLPKKHPPLLVWENANETAILDQLGQLLDTNKRKTWLATRMIQGITTNNVEEVLGLLKLRPKLKSKL